MRGKVICWSRVGSNYIAALTNFLAKRRVAVPSLVIVSQLTKTQVYSFGMPRICPAFQRKKGEPLLALPESFQL
jgi:hypothetical protein